MHVFAQVYFRSNKTVRDPVVLKFQCGKFCSNYSAENQQSFRF
jgi:hypothetical protein